MYNSDWRARFSAEIRKAEEARSKGNEGMARVCSRRAAGVAGNEYLRRFQYQTPGSSAYDTLRILYSFPDLSPEIHEVISHFLIRINPDKNLPVDADLIQEAQWLMENLIGE